MYRVIAVGAVAVLVVLVSFFALGLQIPVYVVRNIGPSLVLSTAVCVALRCCLVLCAAGLAAGMGGVALMVAGDVADKRGDRTRP